MLILPADIFIFLGSPLPTSSLTPSNLSPALSIRTRSMVCIYLSDYVHTNMLYFMGEATSNGPYNLCVRPYFLPSVALSSTRLTTR